MISAIADPPPPLRFELFRPDVENAERLRHHMAVAQHLEKNSQTLSQALDQQTSGDRAFGICDERRGFVEPVETGGLGADTDPGVTGGYGDTGFGALDIEPIPDNTEPEE